MEVHRDWVLQNCQSAAIAKREEVFKYYVCIMCITSSRVYFYMMWSNGFNIPMSFFWFYKITSTSIYLQNENFTKTRKYFNEMYSKYNMSSSMYKMWLCVIKKQKIQTVTTQSKIVEKESPWIHIHDNSLILLSTYASTKSGVG